LESVEITPFLDEARQNLQALPQPPRNIRLAQLSGNMYIIPASMSACHFQGLVIQFDPRSQFTWLLEFLMLTIHNILVDL
jgi:hypothetical protein